MKKCICKKNYDLSQDFGINFIKGKNYEYKEINLNMDDTEFYLYESNSSLRSIPFNKYGFNKFFIDIKEDRKLKLQKIKTSK